MPWTPIEVHSFLPCFRSILAHLSHRESSLAPTSMLPKLPKQLQPVTIPWGRLDWARSHRPGELCGQLGIWTLASDTHSLSHVFIAVFSFGCLCYPSLHGQLCKLAGRLWDRGLGGVTRLLWLLSLSCVFLVRVSASLTVRVVRRGSERSMVTILQLYYKREYLFFLPPPGVLPS